MKRGVHAAAWVSLALAALLLWPQRWGGTMTYDITHGTSMQPTFHTGDLAILRKTGTYKVGDVAAYRSPSLHATVMHRIKTKTGMGYTFRGDNNDFTDADTVTDKEMLGKLLFHVPSVGNFLTWLLNPTHLALAVGGMFLFFSDRKENSSTPAAPSAPAPSAASPLIVRITALRLPQELPRAHVEHSEDLAQLARLHGIAILRDATTDYLMQGGMLYRYVRVVATTAPEPRRHASPQGRDWVYDSRPDADVFDLAARRSNVS